MKNDLHLVLQNKDYKKLKEIIISLNVYDIAEIMNDFDIQEILTIYRLLPKDIASEVFAYLDSDSQIDLISLLTDKEAVHVVSNLYADDATDLLDEMPANFVAKLLSKVDAQTRGEINKLLKYPDNSAGSIMTVEYIDLKASLILKDAIDKIRKEVNTSAVINHCYVCDRTRTLIGSVDIKDILINKEDALIETIMDSKVVWANTLMDQEEVAALFTDYDLTTLPVVDSENRLVGIITIDDIVDIINEEATEDIEKMAAIVPTEKPYLKLSIYEIWKSRIPWLLLLMISATFTGKIIQHYEHALSGYIILTAFIPMLMSSGGNAGSQATITIIRGLALNDIDFKDLFKVITKETKVSIIIGLTMAIINFFKLIIIDQVNIKISLVVSLTLFCAIFIAKIIGCCLPLLTKKIGLDPAVIASPTISTIIDAITLIIYFQIACALLPI